MIFGEALLCSGSPHGPGGKSRSRRAPAEVLCWVVSCSRCTFVCFKSLRMRRLSDKTINMGKGESITIHYLP